MKNLDSLLGIVRVMAYAHNVDRSITIYTKTKKMPSTSKERIHLLMKELGYSYSYEYMGQVKPI